MRPTETFERKNVTELGLELPEKKSEFQFDLKRDITNQDWDWIEQSRQDLPEAHYLLNLLSAVADIDRSRLHVSDEEWRVMEDFLSSQVNRLDTSLKLEKISPGRVPINRPYVQKRLLKQMSEASRHFGQVAAPKLLSQVAEYDPALIKAEIVDWKNIINDLNTVRRNNDGRRIATTLKAVAQLDPSRLEVTERDWQLMRQFLIEFRGHEHPIEFARQAASMSVIARASQAVQPDEDIPALPETKSYYE